MTQTTILASVLSRMEDVLGPGPMSSLAHYAAVEEGKRLALDVPPGDVAAALRRLQDAIGLPIEAKRSGEAWIVELRAALPFAKPGVQGLFVGLVEGVVSAIGGRKFTCANVQPASGMLTMELRQA